VVEIATDEEGYRLFEKFASHHNLEQNEALRQVLSRGKQSYFPQQLAEMVSGYESLKKRILEYKKDNEVLERIHSQTLELKRLISEMEEVEGGV